MAMARAPTTSSSQLVGRNEANEDDEEELLDDVPFAVVSRLRSVRFPISLLSSGMHLQLLVKSKTYLDEHSCKGQVVC